MVNSRRRTLLTGRLVLVTAVALGTAGGATQVIAADATTCSATVAGSTRAQTTRVGPLSLKSRLARTYADLQVAINRAPPGATVTVRGVCSPSPEGSGSFEIVGRRVTLAGGTGGVALHGNGMQPVVRVAASGSVELRNLTIAFGGGTSGAGVLNQGTAVLRRVVVTENRALGGGGGIWNDGEMVVDQSTVSRNVDRNGLGGGIHNTGSIHVSRSAVVDNSSYNSGGGLYNNGTLTISTSTVSGNTTRRGGGITNDQLGTLVLQESTISSNTAYDEPGGGLANLGGVVVGGCPPATSYFGNAAPADPSSNDYVGLDC